MNNTPSDGQSAEAVRALEAMKCPHTEAEYCGIDCCYCIAEALARARADALEEAARVCEGSVSIDESDESWNDACDGCAHKIRTLPAPPQAQPTQDAGGGASEGCPDGYGKRWAARCVNGPETARIIEGVWGDGYLAGLRAAKGAPR
jgi:hypothetical protein